MTSLSLSLPSEKAYKLATLEILENPEPTNQAQLDNVHGERVRANPVTMEMIREWQHAQKLSIVHT